MKRTTVTFLAVASVALLLLMAMTANAEVININNADFEDYDADGGSTRGNWHVVNDWDEEVPNNNQVYIEDNGLTWKPEADRVLYFNAVNTAVNQDLSHTWSSSDSYTLGIIGERAGWWGTSAPTSFKVELRETDGTVLWDSGSLDVTNTVTAAAPYTYTGTGHIFNWTIDASTFADIPEAVEDSPLNIRIAHISGTPYLDDVSLSVASSYDPDVNEDGEYDDLDLQLMLSNFDADATPGDGDPAYNQSNLDALLAAYDPSGGDGGATVPEPASMALLLFGAIGLVMTCRRK